MASQVAYAIAISIVGVSSATSYSIITQAGRIEHIQADLSKGKISIKLQAPKQNVLSSHDDLRNLLYMASHNLYSALQSVDSISGTVTTDTSISSRQLQTTLHDILLKECRNDKRFPHNSQDPLQINITYCGQVQLLTGTLQDTTETETGTGTGIGTGTGTRQSTLAAATTTTTTTTTTQSVMFHSDGNGNGNGNDVVIYVDPRLFDIYFRDAKAHSLELAEKFHVGLSPKQLEIEALGFKHICLDRRLHDVLYTISQEHLLEHLADLPLDDDK